MQEEKLISLIINRLDKRARAQLEIVCQEDFSIKSVPHKKIFFDYHQIGLIQVPISLIHDLYNFQKDPWTDWILTGISYQINFIFDINEYVLSFVPWKMLIQWPICFQIAGNSVVAFKTKLIKREDLFLLKNQSFLVKTSQQQFTAEAFELVKQKKITIVERTDESCIWGK
ncbi:PduM family microcompartment protein [Enterococcus sp. 2201sp1_2201st1_B8_2201SCRN_220225]|uniref:PduM family microcompartment protein n=1 Tax=unclassified Enterococcus TaxID=2608891 RepID=UPI0034A537C5